MHSLTRSIKGLLLILVVCVAGFTVLFLEGQFALRSVERAAGQMGDGKDTREVNAATRQINGNMSTVSSLAEAGNAPTRETAAAGKALGDVSVRMSRSLGAFSV